MRFPVKYLIALCMAFSLFCSAQKLTREQRINNGILMRQMATEDFNGIIILAEKVLNVDSNNTKALFFKALSEYRTNKLQVAYKDFALYFSKRPKSLARLYMAEVNINRGDTTAAIKDLEQALAFKTYDLMVCDNMSKLLPIDNRLKKLWHTAAENNRNNFVAWTAIGIYHEKAGNIKEAYKCYDVAQKALNNRLVAKNRIKYRWIHILKAESAYSLKQNYAAIEAVNSSILLYPEDPLYYKNRIKYYLALDDEKSACQDQFYLNTVGEYYMPKTGVLNCDYKDAGNKPQDAWIKKVKAEKLFIEASKIAWGDSTLMRKRIVAYSKVLDLVPDHVYALAEIAGTFVQMNEMPIALKYYDTLLLADPTKHEALNSRAGVNADLGYFKEALEDANSAIKLDSTLSDYWVTRANIKIRLSDTTGATNDLSVAIRLNPTNSTGYFNRGILLMQQNKYTPALNDFLKAIDIEEDQPLGTTFAKYYNNAAMAYNMLQQYEKALEQIDHAIALEPENGKFYYRSGEIKARMKDMKGACEDWNIAKKLGYKEAEDLLYYNCGHDK